MKGDRVDPSPLWLTTMEWPVRLTVAQHRLCDATSSKDLAIGLADLHHPDVICSKRRGATIVPQERPPTVRLSVTVPRPDYDELERLAGLNHVSVAWVVRKAIDQFLAVQEPLFRGTVG